MNQKNDQMPDLQNMHTSQSENSSNSKSNQNPFMRAIYLANAVDAWRIFPRVFISTYIYLLYKVVVWFMTLPQPNTEQSALVSVVVGVGAAWFGLYTGSSRKK